MKHSGTMLAFEFKPITMKTRILSAIFFMSIVALGITGCTKEEALETAQKTIKKSWALHQYLHNNAEHTSAVINWGLYESYTDNNKYDRSYTDKNGNKVVETGTYIFEDAGTISVMGMGSMEISPEVGTVSSSKYNVIKLTDSEYWYYYMNGGDRHEFHFNKK